MTRNTDPSTVQLKSVRIGLSPWARIASSRPGSIVNVVTETSLWPAPYRGCYHAKPVPPRVAPAAARTARNARTAGAARALLVVAAAFVAGCARREPPSPDASPSVAYPEFPVGAPSPDSATAAATATVTPPAGSASHG